MAARSASSQKHYVRLGLLGLAALAVTFTLVGLALPHTYTVEHSLVIDATPERVFAQIDGLSKWSRWGPWEAADPTMKREYSGPETGVGARVSWTSENSGAGTQEIVMSEPPSRMNTEIEFEGLAGSATTQWNLDRNADQTKLRWSMHGRVSGPVGGYLALLLPRFIGHDYEHALAKLQAFVEGDRNEAEAGDGHTHETGHQHAH